MKSKKHILWAVLAGLLTCLLFAILWATLPTRDRIFHGIPESTWIAKIIYFPPPEQVKEWRSFGSEGIAVLTRALDNSEQPGRRLYHKIWVHLPPSLAMLMPKARPDTSSNVRMRVLSLLKQLDYSESAVPSVMRLLEKPDPRVRQLAISYFTKGEDTNAPLNKVPSATKRELFPLFLDCARDPDWAVRNNALIALRYYPEESENITPMLLQLLKDAQPQVQLLAADALNRLNPGAVARSGAIPAIISLLSVTNDQISYRATVLLGEMRQSPQLSIPALLVASRGTDPLLAGSAISALVKYPEEKEQIVPVLAEIAQGPHRRISKYAKEALVKLNPPGQ